MIYQMQKIKNFFLFAAIFLLIQGCQYIFPKFIDEKLEIIKINDSIFYDNSRKTLLLDISNGEGMFKSIGEDGVIDVDIKKDTIFFQQKEKHFIFTKDTVHEIEYIPLLYPVESFFINEN